MEGLILSESLVSDQDTLYDKWLSFIDVRNVHTQETYRKALIRFFEYLKLTGTQKPTRNTIISFREDYLNGAKYWDDEIKDYIEIKKHQASTVQLYLTTITMFFKWLHTENLYDDIAAHIKMLHIETGHTKDRPTKEQLKTVLSMIDTNTLKGKRDYAIILLAATSALRVMEVANADIKDFTRKGNKQVLYIQGKGRNSKKEYVDVAEPAERAILDYLKARNVTLDDDAPLFVSTSNNNASKRMTTRSISAVGKQALKNAGLNSSKLTFHSFRHYGIDEAIEAGYQITDVRIMARHKNINTTMIYVHEKEREKNPCVYGVADALFS